MEGSKLRCVGVCLTACALLVSGCGGDDGSDSERIESALSQLEQAIDAGDAKKICVALGASAREQLIEVGHGRAASCTEALRQFLPGLRKARASNGADPVVRDVARTAVVTIDVDGRTTRVPFVEEDGEWRLDSFYGLAPRPSEAIR